MVNSSSYVEGHSVTGMKVFFFFQIEIVVNVYLH